MTHHRVRARRARTGCRSAGRSTTPASYVLDSGSRRPAGRRARRAVHRRCRPGPRLPGPAGADRRAVRRRPGRRRGARRTARATWPAGCPTAAIEYLGRIDHAGQGARLPDRARRDRGDAAPPRPRVTDAVVVAAQGTTDGQTHAVRRTSQPATRSPRRTSSGTSRATLPDYMVPGAHHRARRAAADPQRQARPACPARARTAELDGAAVRGPAARRRRSAGGASGREVLGKAQVGVQRQLLRARRQLHPLRHRAGAGPRGGADVHLPAAVPAPDGRRRWREHRPASGADVAAATSAARRSSCCQPRTARWLPAGVEDAYPMSQLQAGLVFQSELRTAPPSTTTSSATSSRARFDAASSRRRYASWCRRNPIFRTSYHLDRLQRVPPARARGRAAAAVHRRPARDLSETEQEDVVPRLGRAGEGATGSSGRSRAWYGCTLHVLLGDDCSGTA